MQLDKPGFVIKGQDIKLGKSQATYSNSIWMVPHYWGEGINDAVGWG
jgi:hypothetical protein